MKILAIHNYHRTGSASGDDQVFKSETKLLEEHGHTVYRYSVSNDEFDNSSFLCKIGMTLGMIWSHKHYKTIVNMLNQCKPDLVHVHTFFPLLSPSILYAVKACNVPVVTTLHDTRFVCPCATSLRDGQLCNLCGDGKYLRMCRYRCFKGSRLQSLWVSSVFKYHRWRRSFYNQIDKYICLNDMQIRLLKNIGFDENKIIKKYNFCPDANDHGLNQDGKSEQGRWIQDKGSGSETDNMPRLPERYVVFYGRIGEEKGLKILMQVWNNLYSYNIPLVIMGSGPLEEDVRAWTDRHSNVFFLGYTEHDKCLSIVKKSQFVVFPSLWYEGCSMVEIETMSLGKGIIAFDLGFSSEAIINNINGRKVQIGDAEGFRYAVEQLWNDSEFCLRLGRNARRTYEENFQPGMNYKQLIKIYEDLVRA